MFFCGLFFFFCSFCYVCVVRISIPFESELGTELRGEKTLSVYRNARLVKPPSTKRRINSNPAAVGLRTLIVSLER